MTRSWASPGSKTFSADSASRATYFATDLRPWWTAGVLIRFPYSEHPPRDDYRLTQKGRDLWPVLTSMRQWGDQYAAPDGPPIEIVHRSCGQISHAEMSCAWCGERLNYRNVQAVAGPGRTRHASFRPTRTSAPSVFECAEVW